MGAAAAVATKLRARGFQVWLDGYALHCGTRLERAILDALEDADALFVLISRSLVAETWFQAEIQYSARHAIPLAVLRLEPTPLPSWLPRLPPCVCFDLFRASPGFGAPARTDLGLDEAMEWLASQRGRRA